MIDIIYSGKEGRKGNREKGNRNDYFSFRIISLPDGTQVIDTTLKTPYSALTAVQMVEYTDMDVQLAIMERMKRRERRESEHRQKEAGHRQRCARNPLYRLAYFCGLV